MDLRLQGETMTKQISFTRYENKLLHTFRQKINQAESTEDVNKFFSQVLKTLFEEIFGEGLDLRYEDFRLRFDKEPHFLLSDRVYGLKNFRSIWGQSDLCRIINNFAESATGRYKHLEKGPQKTEAKIRM
jgi:hypothetical protein